MPHHQIFLHREFVACWRRLTQAERASVQRLLDLLANGDLTPGMRPHPVGSFVSYSPNMDLRIIAARSSDTTTMLYVDHHHAAYRWAAGRGVLGAGLPVTELVRLSSRTSDATSAHVPLPAAELLQIPDPDAFLEAVSEMSPEWQEWLLASYLGEQTSPQPASSSLVFCPKNEQALEDALRLDAVAWQFFLHPTQRAAVDEMEARSIVVTGGPGTGKTVVLLRRIIDHAPKGRETECTVLLTYSEGLAGHLETQLRQVSRRHFYVLPLYFLGGPVPVKARPSAIIKKLALIIEDGRAFVEYGTGERRTVRELLVDETQDAPPEAIDRLRALINGSKTRIVLAADLDQAIHRINQRAIEGLTASCARRFEMTYCYRSTRQIMAVAREWVLSLGATPNAATVFALSGPRVRFIACNTLGDQLAEAVRVLRDLQTRHDPSGLALIYCQYFNPSFKGGSREEAELKRNPDTSRFYRFASLTKGREYVAGVLFVSQSFLAKELPSEAARLRINTLYVSLTRFREEVTVVYLHDCHIEPQLRRLSAAPSATIDSGQDGTMS